MSDDRSELVSYISSLFAAEDFMLNNVLAAQEEGGGPMMNIGPDQGKFLYLLVKLMRPNAVLEIGSYYGYSSLWLGRAVQELGQGQKLYCVEKDPQQAAIVKQHLEEDDLASVSEVINETGLEAMQNLLDQGMSFDMIFVDADKTNYSNYLEMSAKLLPRGGLLLVDNCSWSGKVCKSDEELSGDKTTLAIKDFNQKLAESAQFDSVILTVQDGLAFAIKK